MHGEEGHPLLYIALPEMVVEDDAAVRTFADGMARKLRREQMRILSSDTELRSRPSDVRAVVVFNPPDGRSYRPSVRDLLEHALGRDAVVMPVALYDSCVEPPDPLAGVLAFRVEDVLRRRDLPPTAFDVAGDEVARRLLSKLWPTCAPEQLQLFLSYRTSDASRLTQRLERALDDLQDRPILDVNELRAGAALRSEIEAKLGPCDVLVFLDTPAAAASDWVKWELATAMAKAIPIVWVEIAGGSPRDNLAVWPGDSPDLRYDGDADDERRAQAMAVEIRDRAFEVALAHVRRACTTVDRIRRIEPLTVSEVDQRRQIYCVSRARAYRGRPIAPDEHVIQVFGRRASEVDRSQFTTWFHGDRTTTRTTASRAAYGFLLSSSPMSPGEDDSVVATHAIAYIEEQSGATATWSGDDLPELLLLGAYPRGEGSSQEIREAVQELTTTWLSRGGRLRFGGHPSITPLVNVAAQAVVGPEVATRVTMYQSAWFPPSGARIEIDQLATVVITEAGVDLASSLTTMRLRMVTDSAVAAAVAVGGRTTEGGTHLPGVEQEVALATARGIAVHLLGRTGGHTMALIERSRRADPPWSNLVNRLSPDENEELATTDDYWAVARAIWERHVS